MASDNGLSPHNAFRSPGLLMVTQTYRGAFISELNAPRPSAYPRITLQGSIFRLLLTGDGKNPPKHTLRTIGSRSTGPITTVSHFLRAPLLSASHQTPCEGIGLHNPLRSLHNTGVVHPNSEAIAEYGIKQYLYPTLQHTSYPAYAAIVIPRLRGRGGGADLRV